MRELLVDKYPKIAKEWHPTKNGSVKIEDIYTNSSIKYWWQCQKNPKHEWETRVSARTRFGTGCPYCSGKKVLPEDSFAAHHPDLLTEFHPTKNKNIDPYKLTPRSNKKVWWKCSKNPKHEWQATIVSRTMKGYGCRQCLLVKNSLAESFPEIAKEWHPIKNGDLTPHDVAGKVERKVWWQCSKDPSHEWQMLIRTRTKSNKGCPHCRKTKKRTPLPTVTEFSKK